MAIVDKVDEWLDGQASGESRQWVARIRSLCSDAEYGEAKYWAQLRNVTTGRTVAQLNPRKTQVRVFLCLPPGLDSRLTPGPATGAWADRYPSVFVVHSDSDVETAAELVRQALLHDSEG